VSGFKPREGQRQILECCGGLMGVSAVPGSGKTMTIAALAARFIAQSLPDAGQVLVVTYQNAAVDNLRARIRDELAAMELLQTGYDVRTLHSLSYGIIKTNPGLAGTTEDFQVVDERTFNNLMDKAIRIWNGQNTRIWGHLAPGDYYDQRWEDEWRRIAQNIARTVVTTAKNRRLKPDELLARIKASGEQEVDQFLRIGAEIYQLYQQQLETIGGLDFNDLVWLAVELLDRHPDLCARLRRRWPVVLEDEAQDSVPLQEELIGLLVGVKGNRDGGQGNGEAVQGGEERVRDNDSGAQNSGDQNQGNWVRVGDPNQAIMSTFTAADPRYLRRFLERPEVETVEMTISGRCAERIIDLANHLVDWTCEHHPLMNLRRRAFRPQQIRATTADDPQRNPGVDESDIAFREYNNRQEEMRDIVRRARLFARSHPNRTLGILVPTNRLGYDMAEYLRDSGVVFDEMLQSTSSTRQVTDTLGAIMAYLAEPLRRNHLEAAYMAMRQVWPSESPPGDADKISLLLRSCYRPESLLFPEPETQPEDALPPGGTRAPEDLAAIRTFARYLQRWLRATALPVDQLVMTVAQDLMTDADLARAQQLAGYLRVRSEQNLDWRLPEMARELDEVARGRAVGLSEEDIGFEPQPGKVTLTTMHRAKGLEWDLVYLMGVDGRWFPHTLEDEFLGEYDFLGGDPAAEARAALLALSGEADPEGMGATSTAHMEIIAERLRLLYVGITRARRYLAVSWSREIPTATRSRSVPQAAAFHLLKEYYASRYGNGR
jgi:DNA helicase-2/ATP-dependent DNA helicase PcrA